MEIRKKTPNQETSIFENAEKKEHQFSNLGKKIAKLKKHQFWKMVKKNTQKNTFLTTIAPPPPHATCFVGNLSIF